MPTSQMIVVFIVLVVAAAFLFLWRRRDTGHTSDDHR